MRSPEPLLVLRWQLHPRPTGGRRFAVAYLAAASGVAVAAMIIAAGSWMSGSCRSQGFGCLSGYFRGVTVAIMIGLTVVLAVSITLKLGAAYLLTLISAVPMIALLGALLNITAADGFSLPAMIIFAVAAPALSAWTSARITAAR